MGTLKKVLSVLLVLAMVISLIPANKTKAATVKLSKTSVTIDVGDTVKLKLTGTSSKVKWSSSNKKVATVNSKGKVTGKSEGTARIIAKANSKKYTCKVTVENPAVESYDELADFIMENGVLNDNGIPYVYCYDNSYTYSIFYEEDEGLFSFVFEGAYNGTEVYFLMEISEEDITTGYIGFVLTYSQYGFTSTSSCEVSEYSENTSLKFNVEQNNGYSNDEVQSLSNQAMAIGMVGWEYILENYLDLTFEDLGFVLY